MNRWSVLLAMILISTVMVLGCSGGGDNPMSPDTGPELTQVNPREGDVQTHLWGCGDIYIDVETQTVEVVANRDVAFTLNITQFINKPATNLGFKFHGAVVTPEFADVDLDISITHPFTDLTDYNVYDVRWIIMGTGSLSLNYQSLAFPKIGGADMHQYDYELGLDPDHYYPDPYSGPVGMPDGYTRWFNASEFQTPGIFGYVEGVIATPGYTHSLNSNLNAYKYYADGLSPDGDVWDFLETTNMSGLFTAGATNTRNHYLRFPTASGIKFGYAIIANWEGPNPEHHPSNTVETVGCRVDNNSTVYYVDDTNKGGDLILDIHTWSWAIQPTKVIVEATVLSSPVEITSSIPGGVHYETWQVNTPADHIMGVDGNEFVIICEFEGYDYKNILGVPNSAGDDPLAGFFRFDLPVGTDPDCQTSVVGITPDTADVGSTLDDVSIEVTELEEGPSLAARLSKTGNPDIVGTDVQFVDFNHLTADFDLAGAAKGLWDVVATNGCGGIPGVGVEMFEITGGFVLIDNGPLPGPAPTSSLANMDFSVVGDDTNGYAGVYYYYSDMSPGNYEVYYYPLDYSADGAFFYLLDHNWPGDVFGGPEMMTAIEVSASGITFLASECTDLNEYDPEDYETRESYWVTDETGYISMCNFWWDCPFRDFEFGFGPEPELWAFWGYDFSQTPDGYESKVIFPYDDLDKLTEYETYFPVDYSGNADGEVSDLESFKTAIDTNPQGLNPPYDIIHYYLEGPPDDPGIEVFQNSVNGPIPLLITTIDTALQGTAVDISCLNAYGNIDGATGNYLCVLEDNGDSTWQVALFDQDGNLIVRYPTSLPGDGLALDCDTENQEIHIWVDNGGTLEYARFGYY